MADSAMAKVLLISVLSFSAFYTFISYLFNQGLFALDFLIGLGYTSLETTSNLSTMLELWKLSPIVFLVGLIFWMIERAKGSNITPGTFYTYETVLILSIVYSVIWLISYGSTVDAIVVFLIESPLVLAIPAHYNPTNVALGLARLVYVFCCVPAYLGCFLFMIHPIVAQSDSLIYGGGDDETEYVTNFEQI